MVLLCLDQQRHVGEVNSLLEIVYGSSFAEPPDLADSVRQMVSGGQAV